MSVTQLKNLKHAIAQLLEWDGTKTARKKIVDEVVLLYHALGAEALSEDNQEIYDLYDLSARIFNLAKKEIEEANQQFEKERKKGTRRSEKPVPTPLFELSIQHLKRCCQQGIDHNQVPWIAYCLKLLEFPITITEKSIENEISNVLLLSSNASQLHWAEHAHLSSLWKWIWSRVETADIGALAMRNYMELAANLLENVDYVVFEKSPIDLMAKVMGTLKKSVEMGNPKEYWCHYRKFSVVHILSYIVHRWGLEARDFILREIFELTGSLSNLISVAHKDGEQSKKCIMRLIDDLVKLAMIETVHGHRTMNEVTRGNIQKLVKTGIQESLKSAHRNFSRSSTFSISEECVRYLTRWLLAERRLEQPSAAMNESFELTGDSSSKKKDDATFDSLIDLSFGSTISGKHKLNAWNGVMQILNELLKSRRLELQVTEKIVTILWEKRKSYTTEPLRTVFCSILSTVVCQADVRFGHRKVPTIDSILKYSLSLMPNVASLPSAAALTETIVRFRTVSREGLRNTWDTVSRTSSGSFEVVRLISALISVTEFDENSRFANDERVRSWSFRKDIIEWVLLDPNAHSHKLLYQLCQYHPTYCYESEASSSDDSLLQTLKLCKLACSPAPPSAPKALRPLEASIEEIVRYVHDKLKSILATEITLPAFVLCHEFALKYPDRSYEFNKMYKKLYQIMEDQEEDEFLQSARHFSKWPQNLTLPIQKQTINCMAVFFEANLDNQLVDLCQWSDRRKVLVEMLAELAATRSEIRDKLQKSMPFNKFVKECIMENRGDLYEMTKRFEKYSFLLSIRNLIVTRMIITNEAARLLGDGETISETDIFIIEKRTLSTCIRNVSEGKELSGYTLDPYTVAANVHNVHFDHINVEIYLELLKKSPFFAQNIVRHLLRQNGKEAEEETWHLHATVLKIVMKDEKLLAVCVATIPNMVRYLKVYQIHFSPKSNAAKFLHLDMESISHCQSYLRKPTKSSNLITAANFLTLFGCEKRTWKRPILRFWSIFKQQPAMCCEKLLIFAEECVELGLNHRIACLLRALTTSEFCRKALCDEYLKIAFQLTYRSIFLILSKNECRPEIVELCDDMNLRYDLLQHQIKHVAAHHLEHFERFETKIAFSVEKFLKSGIDGIDFEDLGLVEFYKQLNENLTEDAIRSNEARNIYIVDILSTIWLQLPSIRPQILPILARFKHISPAWTNFPQPPHISTNEKSFLQHLRFHLYLKMMNISKSMTQGEYATCIMMLLTSYDSSHFVADLIEKKQLGKLKLQQRRNVLCILSRLLKDQAVMGDEDETIIDPILFKAITKASAVFEDTAACIVPFLFKICVDFKGKYDKCVINLLGCLKGVNAEDEIVVRCLAECVDSIGLNVIARYERLNIETHSEFGVKWFFKLSRLFLKHGFTTHSFAIANILFDRLSARKRNTMMIDRTSLDRIDRSQELINLLVEIYVAEGNSVALSSLPPAVQNRPDVRQVMNKSSKEWLKLLSSNQMDSWELTIVQWMCGIQFNAITGDKYLNSILRCNFNEYTKKIDSPLKFVYFQLFHLSTSTLEIEEAISSMPLAPTIDQMRLMIIANATASFEPQSVEEHVVRAVRELRETSNRRKSGGNVKGINEKTTRMVKLAEMLTENKAYDAAINLLDTWEHECLQWTSVAAESIDIDLIRICKQHVTCRSGDPRMADINLRTMHPRVPVMSDLAIAEWSLALSKITIEYRNDMEEGIRILEFGCKHLQNKDSVETRLKVLLKLHSVCIGQLSKLEEYRETRTYRMKQQAVTAFEQQIQNSCRTSLARGNSGDEWTKKTVQRVRKEHQFEKNDLEKVDNSLNSAARKAVSSGFDALLCISQLEDDDEAIRASSLIIFPLIDVIYKYETDVGVIALLKEHTKSKLPSKLWISATSHIASKCFSIEKSQITRHLSQILCHLIYDYPYHVLHTILMYDDEKNASKVKGFLKTIFDARADQRDSSKLKEIVITIREAHQAYREIAMLDVRGNVRIQRVEINGKTMYRWPHDLKIFKCKLRQLPIPTISQKIGCPGDYSTTDLITWKRWKDVFTIADGISTPKIWEIEGSDGKWYKTVWKKDDVRQDVLVEQMFDVTNNMLEKAMLRTYNVVPLDTECGVIEFCGGTVSLKEVMCGVTREGGLHREFNSEEVSASKVSSMMRQVQTESTETRRQVFVEICQQYSPVFRHFFYTNFSTAQIWRQKIINYRQSLATWSIVCYIVGLGDRHASNILFDQKLCTFVHIDLGMILEYSKRTLPVPEQVPFRITRDVLDPILIEGIENGQLAEECTQIMEKLKENGKVILGVASALLRETMTNFREAEQAAGRPSYISEMAIGRLREKLRGTDDGVTAQSSNLQIRRLLREATSADNLSRMFCGWMPFL